MSYSDEFRDLFREASCTFTADDGSDEGENLTIEANGISRECVASTPFLTREQVGTGWVSMLVRTALVLIEDFQAMEIEDQDIVTIGGVSSRVVGIEPNPANPIVTLRLASDA